MEQLPGESQPLTALGEEEDEDEGADFDESSRDYTVEGSGLQRHCQTKSTSEMIALTISLAGLQSVYCLQFSDGTDFLLNTGISPTVIASVWIIPPVCGATIQPLLGILSDLVYKRVGRREPFIVLGGIGLLCAVLTLAWSSTLANSLDESCEAAWPACPTKVVVCVLAVFVLYASAQAVQVGTRAKMVDDCPITQQLDVNIWASRIISLTSVLSYILSYGLPSTSGIEVRMQELALVDALTIIGTISIACLAALRVPPSPHVPELLSKMNHLKYMPYFQQLRDIISKRMIRILAIQFLSWFAWFPYLFYISRYITEKNRPGQMTNNDTHDGNETTAERLGPLALFLQSVVHLTTSLFLPSIVRTVPDSDFAVAQNARKTVSIPFTFPGLPPIQLWRVSQALYSTCVVGILLTNSTIFMLVLAAMTGFCWAITQIVPYTMLTEEFILAHDGDHRKSSQSGLFLGINNLSMTIPQIIAGFTCTIIFSTVSEGHTDSLSNGITRSLAAGSLVSLVAVAMSLCI